MHADHEGEILHVTERVVVAPATGVFEPVARDDLGNGASISAGETIGRVRCGKVVVDVTSPFAGSTQGFLAAADERVRRHQPILWLRAA